MPETANWARHSSQSNEQNQPLNFAEIQKQEQEQERRVREAALAAQQLVGHLIPIYIISTLHLTNYQTESSRLSRSVIEIVGS